jgi:hypothetical protein
MFDCAHDHHAGSSGVAQRVMMAVADTEILGEHVEAVTRQFRPRALGDADAVQPGRLDRGPFVNAAGSRQRTLVEIGMGDRDAAGQMCVDGGMDVREAGFARNMIAADAVNARVERREPSSDSI